MIFQFSGVVVTLNIEWNQSPHIRTRKKNKIVESLLLSLYMIIPNVHLTCIINSMSEWQEHNHSSAIKHWALNIDINFWNKNYTKAIFWLFIYSNLFPHFVGIRGTSITNLIVFFFWFSLLVSIPFVVRYDEFDRSVKLRTKVKFNWETQARHSMDVEIWNSHFHLVDSYKSISFRKWSVTQSVQSHSSP